MISSRQDPQYPDQAPASWPVPDGTREDVCRVLAGILGQGVDVHRCLAAQALGRIGGELGGGAAVQPLIAALLDEDEDVRTDAAEALAKLAGPGADFGAGKQLLENLLGDPCAEVKLAAIEALAKLRDGQAIPWLRRMVKGRDEEIVWDEEEFYSSGWDDWVDIQIRAVNALADLNAGEAVPDIVAAIWDEDAQDMTEAAFNALARMGRPGIAALACILNEDSTRLRRRAGAALAATDAGEAVEPLNRALGDPDATVRLAAMRARAARYPADSQLGALLGDPDAAVRAEAVTLCGKHHPDRLPALLDDASAKVQIAALTALAGAGDFPAPEMLTETLRAKLGDEATDLAAAAARAFAAIDPQAALSDLVGLLIDTGRPLEARLGALQGLAAIGGEHAVASLISVLDDGARPIRLEAMSALARLAQAEAVWPNAAGMALLFALRGGYAPEAVGEGEEQDVSAPEAAGAAPQGPAPEMLAEAGDDGAAFPTSTLNAILDDTPEAREILDLPEAGIELSPADMERLALAKRITPKARMPVLPKVVLHEDIRRFAARVLGDLSQGDVARELAVALTASDAEVRMAAADSLARIGAQLSPLPSAVAEAMVAAVKTAERDLKLPLIRALAACAGDGIGDMVMPYLAEADPFVRKESIGTLSRLGRVGGEIAALLDDPDAAVRQRAAEAIADPGASIAASETVKLLVRFAFSFEGYHGRLAASLLRDLDAPRASALFVDVLSDPERKRIWSVAIEALAELNCSRPVLMTGAVDRAAQG